MGISGYEVALMFTVSPFLLGIPPLRRLITSNLPAVQTTTIIGLLAYLFKSPESRLFAVSVAVWQGCLAWSASFWSSARINGPAGLEAKISAWTLGLMASSIVKLAFRTNNPTWPIMNAENGGWNKTGLVLFILALARTWQTQTRATNTPPAQHSEKPKGSSTLAALGFGGLMFGLHSFLSDSSTMILWVWDGYPVRGPLAVPHGAVTILGMGVGLLLGLFYPNLARSWTAFGVGSVGAAVLTAFHGWFGYFAALALTLYLCAVTPPMLSNAVRFPPGRTFFLGFFLYNLLLLFQVWVVAYAFVPGGPLLREHTDWIMASMMISIGCGVFSMLQNHNAAPTSTSTKSTSKPFRLPPNPAAKRQRSYYISILILLQLLSASIAYLRFPAYNYTPYHPESKAITAGIWTVHFR